MVELSSVIRSAPAEIHYCLEGLSLGALGVNEGRCQPNLHIYLDKETILSYSLVCYRTNVSKHLIRSMDIGISF